VRFLVLATGSKGNCAYIATPHAQVLVDCGVGPRKLGQLLARHGISPSQIDAVFISHVHSDHTQGLGPLLRRAPARIYCQEGAAAQLAAEVRGVSGIAIPDLKPFANGDGFHHRDVDVLPVRVSHDAEPTVMYKFFAGGRRIGILTDLGSYDERVLGAFRDCDVLLLEANHDLHLLAHGPYPAFLKQRIRGKQGHLSNDQAAQFVTALPALPGRLLLGHLSEVNNRPEVASAAFSRIETGHIPHLVIPQGVCGPLLEL